MSEATAKYNPDSNSHEEDLFHCGNSRLLCDDRINSLNRINDMALLSKRKARVLLRVGNTTLKKFIDNGDIKIIMVNGKEKIPYVSLQEFIYSMRSKAEYENEEYKFINAEEANVIANKILIEINEGDN